MSKKNRLAKLLDPKRIEKENKKFQKLSPRKQRIAIAEDVVEQVKVRAYLATTSLYVQSSTLEDAIDGKWNEEKRTYTGGIDLQTALLKGVPDCQVCGLGAAFCSMARLGDQVELSDADNIHDTLEPIFGAHQLALIEYAFEGDDAGGTSEDAGMSEEEMEACVNFHEKYPDDNKRLRAIFKNVIKNDGSFEP